VNLLCITSTQILVIYSILKKMYYQIPLMNDICLHRNSSLGSSAEQLDELSVVGYLEEPEVGSLFESSGIC
jgi:hypothetical protein